MKKYYLEIGKKPQYYGTMTYVYQSMPTSTPELAKSKISQSLLAKYSSKKYEYRVMVIEYRGDENENNYDIDLHEIIKIKGDA